MEYIYKLIMCHAWQSKIYQTRAEIWKIQTNYKVRYVLTIVAPVGSETRCLIRHFLRSFGAIINI